MAAEETFRVRSPIVRARAVFIGVDAVLLGQAAFEAIGAELDDAREEVGERRDEKN